MQASVSIITNGNVTKTGSNQVPIQTQALEASRLNFMLHAGRRWYAGGGVIEAGITVTGTFYNRDVVSSSMQQQSIACRSLTTGEVYNTMFDVTTFGIVNERTFWAGAGLHARYQYPVSKSISFGIQVLSSMSTEGILLQAAPRMVISL